MEKYTQGTPKVHKKRGHRGTARWQCCKVGHWVHFTREHYRQLCSAANSLQTPTAPQACHTLKEVVVSIFRAGGLAPQHFASTV